MTIEEVRTKKKELEQDIRAMLNEFYKETRLTVTRIDLDHSVMQTDNGFKRTSLDAVKVNIEFI